MVTDLAFARTSTSRSFKQSGPVPPPSEQAAIVRFLDWANGRLERAIRAKRKIVALLNEQKQAIIHRAVTRGLDPNVPLKDSGCRGWRDPGALGGADGSLSPKSDDGSTPSRSTMPLLSSGGTYPWISSPHADRCASSRSADQFVTQAALEGFHLPS
jgi:type I restriction enzyme S subunit